MSQRKLPRVYRTAERAVNYRQWFGLAEGANGEEILWCGRSYRVSRYVLTNPEGSIVLSALIRELGLDGARDKLLLLESALRDAGERRRARPVYTLREFLATKEGEQYEKSETVKNHRRNAPRIEQRGVLHVGKDVRIVVPDLL